MYIKVDLKATLYRVQTLRGQFGQIESLNWTFFHIKNLFFHKVQ